MAKGTQAAPVNVKKPAATGKAPAVVDKKAVANISEEMLALAGQDAEKGVSRAMDDNVVPLIYILQALSKPAVKKTPEYVEGAEPGMIWFRGTKKCIDGDDGILVQPCHFYKNVVEWRPDRGGYVASHEVDKATDIPGVKRLVDPKNPKKSKFVNDEGNEFVETRYHVVLVHDVYERPMPFVIPMSGSQHSSSRNWMMSMNGKQVPGQEKIAPSFLYMYRMKIEARTNGKDNWFGWEIVDGGDEGEPLMCNDINAYKLARKIHDDFNAGKLRADAEDELETGDEGDASNSI